MQFFNTYSKCAKFLARNESDCSLSFTYIFDAIKFEEQTYFTQIEKKLARVDFLYYDLLQPCTYLHIFKKNFNTVTYYGVTYLAYDFSHSFTFCP